MGKAVPATASAVIVRVLAWFRRSKPQPLGSDPAYRAAHNARQAIAGQHVKRAHLDAAKRRALHDKLAAEVWG